MKAMPWNTMKFILPFIGFLACTGQAISESRSQSDLPPNVLKSEYDLSEAIKEVKSKKARIQTEGLPTVSTQGGFDGGGGNICFLSSGPTLLEFENLGTSGEPGTRLMISNIDHDTKGFSSFFGSLGSLIDYRIQDSEKARLINEIKRVLSRHKNRSATSIHFITQMLEGKMAAPMKMYAVNAEITKPIKAHFKKDSQCNTHNTKAAILFSKGHAFVSIPVWNQLNLTTQAGLLVHETLRVFQRIRKEFNVLELSDENLQQLTRNIFFGTDSIELDDTALAEPIFKGFNYNLEYPLVNTTSKGEVSFCSEVLNHEIPKQIQDQVSHLCPRTSNLTWANVYHSSYDAAKNNNQPMDQSLQELLNGFHAKIKGQYEGIFHSKFSSQIFETILGGLYGADSFFENLPNELGPLGFAVYQISKYYDEAVDQANRYCKTDTNLQWLPTDLADCEILDIENKLNPEEKAARKSERLEFIASFEELIRPFREDFLENFTKGLESVQVTGLGPMVASSFQFEGLIETSETCVKDINDLRDFQGEYEKLGLVDSEIFNRPNGDSEQVGCASLASFRFDGSEAQLMQRKFWHSGPTSHSMMNFTSINGPISSRIGGLYSGKYYTFLTRIKPDRLETTGVNNSTHYALHFTCDGKEKFIELMFDRKYTGCRMVKRSTEEFKQSGIQRVQRVIDSLTAHYTAIKNSSDEKLQEICKATYPHGDTTPWIPKNCIDGTISAIRSELESTYLNSIEQLNIQKNGILDPQKTYGDVTISDRMYRKCDGRAIFGGFDPVKLFLKNGPEKPCEGLHCQSAATIKSMDIIVYHSDNPKCK